jgi:hypothetical protein
MNRNVDLYYTAIYVDLLFLLDDVSQTQTAKVYIQDQKYMVARPRLAMTLQCLGRHQWSPKADMSLIEFVELTDAATPKVIARKAPAAV